MKNLYFIITFLMIILSFSVSADWVEYQENGANEGQILVQNENGVWDQTGIFSRTAFGLNLQPAVSDIDNDGIIEIISGDGNFVSIYYENNKILTIETQINIGTSYTNQPYLIDYDSDNLEEIIVSNRTEIFVLEHNSTLFKIVNQSSYPAGIQAGIKCHVVGGITRCWFATQDSNLSYYLPHNNTFVSCNFTTSSADRLKGLVIVLDDIDLDGFDEAIVECDIDNDGNRGICVMDTNTCEPDTGFSGDGILDDIGTQYRASGIMVQNLDGGTKEIILTGRRVGGAGWLQEIRAIKSDGTTWGTFTITDSAAANRWISNPVNWQVGTAVSQQNRRICAITRLTAAGGDTGTNLSCVIATNGTFFESVSNFSSSTSIWQDSSKITTADMNNDLVGDIITSRYIYMSGITPSLNLDTLFDINPNAILTGHPIPQDLNDDNLLDIAMQGTSQTYISFSTASNQNPVLWDNLSHSGYFGFYTSPVCLNTTITYQARDCNIFNDCNYNNDNVLDTERLITNCGQLANGNPASDFTTNRQNGTYDLNNPLFQCYYNVTGSYAVRIYIQDDANPTNYTVFNTETITINVIDGIPGDTCNNPAGLINTPNANGASTSASGGGASNTVDSSVDFLVTGLVGTSANFRLFIGTLILLVTIIGSYVTLSNTGGSTPTPPNTFIMGIISFLGLIIVTFFLNLYPIWLFILLMVILAFISFLAGSIGKSSDTIQ